MSARPICDLLRAPAAWTAHYHGEGQFRADADAAPFKSADLIEELAAALDQATDMCAVYADYIRNDVPASGVEVHPYLPGLEDIIETGRSIVAKARGEVA